MRKSILTFFKSLFVTAFAAAMLLACEDERPQIILPDPIPEIPQKEFRYVESLTPDTVRFKMRSERDSIIFNIRTIPYDLLRRDTVTVQVADSTGAQYPFAEIKSYTLGSDSVWNIKTYINKGIKTGDVISIKVAIGDTTMYSDPIVLCIIPREHKTLESLAPDTIKFDQVDTTIISVKTLPLNLLARDSVKIAFTDTAGAAYDFAEIKSVTLNDSIWNIVTHITYGMKSGDIVRLRISDEDTAMFTAPIVLYIVPKPVPVRYHYSIALTSDSVTGFIKDGQATIRVKTEPWDALFNDTAFTLSVIDTAGVSLEERISIASKDFMPKDSCWQIKFDFIDKNVVTELAQARLTCPDTVVTSKFFLFKRVIISMTSVNVYVTYNGKSEGKKMNGNTSTSTFSYCIPAVTDFSRQKFLFTHNGDKITVGDSALVEKQYNTLNANKPIVVTVWKNGATKDFTIKLTNTGLPIVRINTNGQSVSRRDTWVTGSTMRIELPDGTVDYEGSLSLKGRGNQTWSDFSKKPYALRLDEKAKILGMHKQKRWVLLANVKDRTLLRNDVSLWISKQTQMPYTVSGEFVELVWNGEHKGNYYLCEQIRIDNHRVDIHNPNLDDPEKGGYLMEIDALYNYKNSSSNNDKAKWADKGDELGFWTTKYRMPYIFKDPDEDEEGHLLTTSSKAYKYMHDYIENMETAISKASSTNHDWQNYLDIDRAVDFVLIQEITMNHDAYNNWPENGPHSTFLYKDSCGKMCFGPVWDFDYHTYTLYGDFENSGWGGSASWNSTENPRIKQWEILSMANKSGSYYFANLVKDPQFKLRLLERWNDYKTIWAEGFNDYVDQMAEKNRASWSYNDKLWGCPSKQNGDWELTYDNAIKAMKDAFKKRMDWISANIGKL